MASSLVVIQKFCVPYSKGDQGIDQAGFDKLLAFYFFLYHTYPAKKSLLRLYEHYPQQEYLDGKTVGS